MAKWKPWLKLWVEWIHDPKMFSLTWAEKGMWCGVITLAQQCVADGQLVKGDGTPLTIPEIANSLHITSAKDRKTLEGMISKMAGAGSLHWNSNTLVITHFAERQAKTSSETPEAIRERQRRHRERKAGVTDFPLHPLTTPTTAKEEDIDIEVEVESHGENLVTRNGKTVTAKAILAEIVKCHEENFGIITPLLAEKFKDFAENYRGTLEWIKDAFAEAVSNNVRKWAYVEKILDTWQSEGRKSHGKQKQRKDTRDEAHQRGDKEPSAERYRQSLER